MGPITRRDVVDHAAVVLRQFGCLTLFTYAALAVGAESGGPRAGAFAFDWLRPATARCEAISAAMAARFRDCERRPGAFGLSDPLYVCRVDGRREYLVFDSRAACRRNLETMHANAP